MWSAGKGKLRPDIHLNWVQGAPLSFLLVATSAVALEAKAACSRVALPFPFLLLMQRQILSQLLTKRLNH